MPVFELVIVGMMCLNHEKRAYDVSKQRKAARVFRPDGFSLMLLGLENIPDSFPGVAVPGHQHRHIRRYCRGQRSCWPPIEMGSSAGALSGRHPVEVAVCQVRREPSQTSAFTEPRPEKRSGKEGDNEGNQEADTTDEGLHDGPGPKGGLFIDTDQTLHQPEAGVVEV